jgi:hypothetical protein
MSVPKNKLHELINELEEEQTSKVFDFLESLKKKQEQKNKPSDFFGIWKDADIDVEKVCKELGNEWDRNIL